MSATPVNPAASAAVARSTIASMGRRIWGRKRNSSGRSVTAGTVGDGVGADEREEPGRLQPRFLTVTT